MADGEKSVVYGRYQLTSSRAHVSNVMDLGRCRGSGISVIARDSFVMHDRNVDSFRENMMVATQVSWLFAFFACKCVVTIIHISHCKRGVVSIWRRRRARDLQGQPFSANCPLSSDVSRTLVDRVRAESQAPCELRVECDFGAA